MVTVIRTYLRLGTTPTTTTRVSLPEKLKGKIELHSRYSIFIKMFAHFYTLSPSVKNQQKRVRYRQRNIFLYPPQTDDVCNATDNASTGEGVCGTNGNTKIFKADQTATTCSKNDELAGDIEGPYIQGSYSLPTKTQLVGQDNAVLYQVFIPGAMIGADEEDRLYQSQLTTFSQKSIYWSTLSYSYGSRF